jgi:hypothetical protein
MLLTSVAIHDRTIADNCPQAYEFQPLVGFVRLVATLVSDGAVRSLLFSNTLDDGQVVSLCTDVRNMRQLEKFGLRHSTG